ncbi:MAG: pseudouridine synthase [Gammaproteobacteria bacterium]|nr:pseudouridine synthase [Gammaproteobacteria bacterium]
MVSDPECGSANIDAMGERLQKVLANTGFGSRRELETWISAGEIRLNGRTAKLGDRAELNDDLVVRGRNYRVVSDVSDTRRVLIYYKPAGEVTTRSDPENRRTVFEALPKTVKGRWIVIGRLDLNTQGMLMVTNDGQLANLFMHPSSNIDREYAVRVNGAITPEVLERLRTGVELDDGMAHFNRLVEEGGDGRNQWFRVTVTEGRNRLVRRLWESQELTVSRLIRTRFGTVILPKWMKRGDVHEMPPQEVQKLAKSVGLKETSSDTLRIVPVHPRHKRRSKRRR